MLTTVIETVSADWLKQYLLIGLNSIC